MHRTAPRIAALALAATLAPTLAFAHPGHEGASLVGTARPANFNLGLRFAQRPWGRLTPSGP